MTREEHIENLFSIMDSMPDDTCGDWRDSIAFAISALQQEPCTDAISRQAVLSHIKTERGNGHEQPFDYVEADVIRALPPVTPAENVGRWEWNQYDSNPKIGNWHCSQCHGIGKSYYDYCPYCGCKMCGGEEE